MSDDKPIAREHYMSRIRRSSGPQFIKVLTGIRRCGKSTLLRMFIDELGESGVPDDRILRLNLDDDRSGAETFGDLITIAESELCEIKGSHIFLGEVQNIPQWERAVSTFYARGADVYITGSNSDMLSSELSTKLSGRCLEIRIRPLMFSEYLDFRASGDRRQLLEDYMRYGGSLRQPSPWTECPLR